MTQMMTQPGAASQGTFVPAEFFNVLGNLTRADADACDFGVIQLDDAGNGIMANRYQADLAGLTPSAYEGKHWFTKIAPCTNNALIYGTFKKGIAGGALNVVIPYTFTFKMKPTNVRLHMYRCPNTGKNFVFCAKL